MFEFNEPTVPEITAKKVKQAIDTKQDDGNAATGSVRALLQTAVPMPVTTTPPTLDYVDTGSNLYVLCKSIQ